jgi:hypothetical protein
MRDGDAPAPVMMRGVPVSEIGAVWLAVAPLLERATRRTRGRVSVEALRPKLETGEMQLWIAEPLQLACLTEVILYPHQRWCRVAFAAGRDLRLCRAGLALIEAWARAKGCVGVEIEGRAGWVRALPGYSCAQVILRKEL